MKAPLPIASAVLAAVCSLTVISILAMAHPALADEGPPPRAGLQDIRITEIMYHPLDFGLVNGDSLEFIELKNTGVDAIDLGGVGFVEGIAYTFAAGATLEPGALLVLAVNPVEFEARYGFAPFGEYSGRLDNAGERLTLADSNGGVLLTMRYTDRYPWPMGADGLGFSIVPIDEAGPDIAEGAGWRTSRDIHGSPGDDDPAAPVFPPIVINEVLTHTDPPASDAIELYNPSDTPADLSGWYLTDDPADPDKFVLPPGTTILAKGYLVFDEGDFNPNPGVPPSFALSALGDAAYLFSANASSGITGYVRGFEFGGADNGVSFGRYELASGEEDFPPQLTETLGAANSGPRHGPILISEIMYNPLPGGDEFIELVNIENQTIPLYDLQFPDNTWQVSGVGFSFRTGDAIGPLGIALLVPIDPETFKARYNVPTGVPVFGPYPSQLNNGGETLRIEQPDEPNQDGTVDYFEVERVVYDDAEPWPESADGAGRSLIRQERTAYSNDPASWLASNEIGGTPGRFDIDVSVEKPTTTIEPLTIESVFPNPAHGAVEVLFSVNAPERVRLVLYDMLGRAVRTVYDRVAPAGRQAIPLATEGLPAGVYFLKIEGSAGAGKSRAVVIR